MRSSLTEVLLSPIERPRCARCRTRMELTSIVPRAWHSEKRTFDCPKCKFIETRVVADLPASGEVDGLADKYRTAAMNDDLSLVQIVMRVGMSCALTAVTAVGIFMVIRFVAWVG
jgi:hypothetical protein